MKGYLEKKSNRIDFINTLKYNAVRIIFFTVVVITLIIIFTVFDIEKDLANSIFGSLLFIFIFLIVGFEIYQKSKLGFKTEDILLLTIFTAFTKHLKINKKEAYFIISDIFETYNQKEIVRHFENIFASEIQLSKCTDKLSRKQLDTKLFIVYTLLNISSNDRLYSLQEEEFVTNIIKQIKIRPIRYQQIKSIYTKQGLKEERKIIEEQKRKKIEASFLPFNAYKVMGVTPKVMKAQLKKAYRTLAKKYHPDKFHGQSEDIIKKTEEKFSEIDKAYEIIKKHKNFS